VSHLKTLNFIKDRFTDHSSLSEDWASLDHLMPHSLQFSKIIGMPDLDKVICRFNLNSVAIFDQAVTRFTLKWMTNSESSHQIASLQHTSPSVGLIMEYLGQTIARDSTKLY
jgi:hypothetical protein